jgi:hypothetical protein
MCKEMLVIPVIRVVDKKRIHNWKNWRTEGEERHKGLQTKIIVMSYSASDVNSTSSLHRAFIK